jgi:hypothetical protein
VLDTAMASRDRPVSRVGTSDRQRLERHFDEIRALEERLAAAPPEATASCAAAGSRTDPAVGGDSPGSGSDDITSPSTGYSDEHRRARIMCDPSTWRSSAT